MRKMRVLAVLILSVTIVACIGFGAAISGLTVQSNVTQLQNGVISGVTAATITPQTAVSGLTLRYTYTGDKYNYVAAGMGVRNTGRGTISVRMPTSTNLVAGYLYWTILDGATPNSDNTKITINGVKVTGTMIGSGPSPAWITAPNGYTYRASVTSLLYPTEGAGGVSYGLEIGGINTIITSGASPWNPTSTDARMAESVHLVIVFKDPSLAGPTTVQIYDGYYEQSGGTATYVYNWPARTSGTARFSHLLADGQEVMVTPFSKSVSFTRNATTTIIDGAGALNGNDPSLTSKATYQGSLSDTDTYNVGTLVPVAGGASTITWQLNNDCVSWAGMVFATGVD